METLVLTQSYQPVARVTWQRAMTLMCLGKVEVVDEYSDREIRSMSVTFKMPSIVRFLHTVRRKKKAIKFSRENVYARDKGRCQYCQKKIPRAKSTYDHVTPKSKGGRTTWDNIVISCIPCNQKKKDLSPAQAGMRLKTRPIRPKSLPNVYTFTMTWRDGMPPSWRDFMASYQYWNSELDE